MSAQANIILGLSPGTHQMGIVLYYNGEFMDWRLRTFPGKWNDKKLETILAIIERLFDKYEPPVVAIKISDLKQKSKGMKQILKGIQKLTQKREIQFHTYTLKEMERYCSKEKRVTKRA